MGVCQHATRGVLGVSRATFAPNMEYRPTLKETGPSQVASGKAQGPGPKGKEKWGNI